ncbi:MAG: PKD domain-containing protein, partial [Planctomycetota bacterium]|nr:PKD domain-containing protein [Planctomycetota bacterium]
MAVHLLSEGMMLQISAKISAPVIFSKAMIRFVLMALFSVTIAGCGSGGSGGASLTPEPTIASFTSDVTEGPYDLLVQFTDTTSGSVEGWLWDFGDGSTSTDQNPSHIYTDSGSFTVSLTATGALESDTTVCQDCILVTSPAPIANFEPDTTSGTYDLLVNFVDLSTGPIDSWLWDFGDGNTSSLQNPAHVYGSEGIYSVSLLVEGPGGSDTMTCDSCITVSAPPPVANFDASPTTGVRDLLVQFTDSSTGPVSSWLWNFGDGSTSDLQNPEHLYTAAGSFEVTLEVTGPGGSDTMICSSCITVEEQAPSAAFTPSTTSGVRDLEVTFQDDSVGVITEWSWDFGDGNTSLDQSPTHTYTEAGLYTVSLTVTGPGGQDIATCASCIEVLHPAPVADFSFDPASGTYDLEVQFTDSSTGPITSWSWDFGDGSSSTEQNPLHVYSEAGSYSVTLTVEGPGGSDLITCNGCIDVSHPAPAAGFTPSGTQGDYDLLVEFTNTSTGPISEYLWDFGDGSTSSEFSPTHVYTTAGSYDVSLTVSGPGGTDTVVCQSCIVVTHPVPVSDFEVSQTRGDYPLTIQFSDLSTGPINIWAWDFGDGSTSNLQNPEHVYTEAGSYNVTLTVIGPGGTDSSSCASCITVTSPAPVASFDVSQTSGDYDLPVTFTSTSTGPVDSYLWDFGDGSSSAEENPTHTYTEAGLYSVLLTVTGPGGADSDLCNSCINVTHPVPQASFSTSTSGGEYDLPVTFTSTSTGTIDALTWDFGDGATSSALNPTHTYTEAGTYTVTLTASGPGGEDTEVCSACITVEHPAPVAGFTPSTTSGIYDLPVTFTSTSTGEISSLAWDFGDGGTSSEMNPTHTYTEAGTYT